MEQINSQVPVSQNPTDTASSSGSGSKSPVDFKLLPKRLLVFAVLVVGLAAVLVLLPKKQEIREKAAGELKPTGPSGGFSITSTQGDHFLGGRIRFSITGLTAAGGTAINQVFVKMAPANDILNPVPGASNMLGSYDVVHGGECGPLHVPVCLPINGTWLIPSTLDQKYVTSYTTLIPLKVWVVAKAMDSTMGLHTCSDKPGGESGLPACGFGVKTVWIFYGSHPSLCYDIRNLTFPTPVLDQNLTVTARFLSTFNEPLTTLKLYHIYPPNTFIEMHPSDSTCPQGSPECVFTIPAVDSRGIQFMTAGLHTIKLKYQGGAYSCQSQQFTIGGNQPTATPPPTGPTITPRPTTGQPTLTIPPPQSCPSPAPGIKKPCQQCCNQTSDCQVGLTCGYYNGFRRCVNPSCFSAQPPACKCSWQQ